MNQVSVTEALAVLNPVAKRLHVLRKNSDLDLVVSIDDSSGSTIIVTVRGETLTYRAKSPILFVRDDI